MNKLGAVALLLVLVGSAAGPAGVDAGRHTVRGKGKDSQNGAFQFRAAGALSQATGEASFVWGSEGTLSGPVDCLWVEGRRAVVSGVLDPLPPSVPYFAVMVKDDPGDSRHPRDLLYLQRSSSPYDCATAYVQLPSGLRIKRGDIKVQ